MSTSYCCWQNYDSFCTCGFAAQNASLRLWAFVATWKHHFFGWLLYSPISRYCLFRPWHLDKRNKIIILHSRKNIIMLLFVFQIIFFENVIDEFRMITLCNRQTDTLLLEWSQSDHFVSSFCAQNYVWVRATLPHLQKHSRNQIMYSCKNTFLCIKQLRTAATKIFVHKYTLLQATHPLSFWLVYHNWKI